MCIHSKSCFHLTKLHRRNNPVAQVKPGAVLLYFFLSLKISFLFFGSLFFFKKAFELQVRRIASEELAGSFAAEERPVNRQVNSSSPRQPPKWPAADTAQTAVAEEEDTVGVAKSGRDNVVGTCCCSTVGVGATSQKGEAKGYTIQEGCTNQALGRESLWSRRLYLSLSSRVTRLVIRPHMRPIRNNMQMLPLITDRM